MNKENSLNELGCDKFFYKILVDLNIDYMVVNTK